jgi:hypothetical protein
MKLVAAILTLLIPVGTTVRTPRLHEITTTAFRTWSSSFRKIAHSTTCLAATQTSYQVRTSPLAG